MQIVSLKRCRQVRHFRILRKPLRKRRKRGRGPAKLDSMLLPEMYGNVSCWIASRVAITRRCVWAFPGSWSSGSINFLRLYTVENLGPAYNTSHTAATICMNIYKGFDGMDHGEICRIWSYRRRCGKVNRISAH